MQHNVIVRCRLQYQSVATPPSDGVLRGALKRFFSHCAPAPRIFSGGRGTSPGVLNLFGPFQAARRSIRALLKFCQEPSRRFTKCFEVLSAVFVHDEQHAQERFECPTKVLKEPTK
jgi:hypothetical protein